MAEMNISRIVELIRYGSDNLCRVGIDSYELDSRLLLMDVTGMSRSELLLSGDVILKDCDISRYIEYIERRAKREPLAYIIRRTFFMGMEHYIDNRVLIPRQETELLVEEVIAIADKNSKVMDICTGSGCIINSIVKLIGIYEAVGVDISSDALEVAKINSDSLKTEVMYYKSDLFDEIEVPFGDDKYDIIVSNPPYIPSEDIDGLMPEVSIYEPRIALDGDEGGLKYYRRIANDAISYLADGGILLLEIGYNQGKAVTDILNNYGYSDIIIKRDYSGCDRIVKGVNKK